MSQIDHAIEAIAERSGHYAIAYAILQLARQQERTARVLDSMGCNVFTPTAGPGTTEYMGMQLEKIFMALDRLGDRVKQ